MIITLKGVRMLFDNNIDEVAELILQQSKNVLCSDLHSLIRGISKIQFTYIDEEASCTDGNFFFCNKKNICRRYYENKNSVNRLLLHSLLHCIFLHPFNFELKNEKLWNLACDIAVENTINNWKLIDTAMSKADVQMNFIKELSENVKNLTAENIYYYLLSVELDNSRLKELTELFIDDSHNIWYKDNSCSFAENIDEGEFTEIHSIYMRNDERKGTSVLTQQMTNTEKVNSSVEENQEAWRKIASHIVTDSENASGLGYTSGIDIQLLKAVSQKQYDYSKFLKKFLMVNETIEVNDDEFDYIFYTYGLELYKNIPIIEPLEYIENTKIKKLFIAIDTSGSVKNDIVQNFIDKTYNILKTTDFFSSQCEIYILQCDSEIQDVAVIHNQKELELYMEKAVLKGFGGTDFNPVFEYIKEICKAEKNSDINGLIYFTDGDGLYPDAIPEFKTVFAIYDNGFDKSKVPSWATVLYINKNDLIR